MEIMEALTEKLEHPLSLHYTQYTLKAILVCTLLYAFGIGIYYMLKLMHKGPQFIYATPESVAHSEEAVILASKRPLTSVEDSVDSNEQERK